MHDAPSSHRRVRGGRALAVCLAVYLGALLAGCSSPSVESPPPMADVPAERELRAELRALSGEVRIKRAGEPGWTQAADGASLYEDDKVRTAPGATVQLHFADGAHVILAGDALVAVAERRPGS